MVSVTSKVLASNWRVLTLTFSVSCGCFCSISISRTEFDAGSVPALVAALAGGNERAQAAEAVLRVLGQPAFEAVAAAYESLDEGGRRIDAVGAAKAQDGTEGLRQPPAVGAVGYDQ